MASDADVLAIKSSGGGDLESEKEGETAHCFPLSDGNVANVSCPFAGHPPDSKQCR